MTAKDEIEAALNKAILAILAEHVLSQHPDATLADVPSMKDEVLRLYRRQ